jgi:hypothetical protein
MELQYGGKNTAADAGTVERLATVIVALTEAAQAGEMDKALMAAKKECATIMRRKR